MVMFWGLSLVAAALFLAMMGLSVPVLLQEAGGMVPFDLRPWGYSVSTVERYLVTISEEGLATYLGLQHLLDMVFPLVFAVALILGFRRFLSVTGARVMSVVAIAGAVADYSENALVVTLLTEPVTPDLVTLASTMTIAKWLFDLICLGVLGRVAVQHWRGRGAARGGKSKRKGKPRARKTGK